MKVMALLLMFVAPMMLAACGNKEEDGISIVGDWQYVSYFEGTVTYSQTGVWSFAKNGTLTLVINDQPANVGTYSVNGDKLTWDFGNGQVVNTILTLTEHELTISAGDRDRLYNLER